MTAGWLAKGAPCYHARVRSKNVKARSPAAKKPATVKGPQRPDEPSYDVADSAAGRGELVLITGISGSGKASVLKAFEDLGYYCVDNLPVRLIPQFAELVSRSSEISRTALVVDVREGAQLEELPAILLGVKKVLPTKVIFLEADDAVLLRRFSETRRPHPLGRHTSVRSSLGQERKHLRKIRSVADLVIDTSKFNVHELRSYITDRFHQQEPRTRILVSCVSFGFRGGLPEDADLVFDVRFLPNPHFVTEFRPLTGRHPKVARYIRSFPQSREFMDRISDLLVYLLPHYIREGKSYLTIAFGCTGGQHRSVMITEEVAQRLRKAGYEAKTVHRDCPK
ncbi:MAG: RNase adapter RapZ [Acidobacteriales bacterium]|nr:RNase adapter RapZ [Terriglobales bacterium]